MEEEKKIPDAGESVSDKVEDGVKTETAAEAPEIPDAQSPSAVPEEDAKAEATAAAEGESENSISDKLWEAVGNISRASADAAARRSDQEKSLKKTEEEAKARIEEAEKKRLEEERTAKLVAEQKLAALEYAENYRKKLQKEKERSESAAKQREREERERAAEKAREERAKEIAEMLERERAEARARSEKAEALLNRVSRAAVVDADGNLQVLDKDESDSVKAEMAAAESEREATITENSEPAVEVTAEEKAESVAELKAEEEVEEVAAETPTEAVEEPATKAVSEEISAVITVTDEEEDTDYGVSFSDDGKLTIDVSEESIGAPIYDYSAWEREMEAYRQRVEAANRHHAQLMAEARRRAGEEREQELRLIAEEEKRFKAELDALKAHRDELADTYERRKAMLKSEVEEYGEMVKAIDSAHKPETAPTPEAAPTVKATPKAIAPETVEEIVEKAAPVSEKTADKPEEKSVAEASPAVAPEETPVETVETKVAKEIKQADIVIEIESQRSDEPEREPAPAISAVVPEIPEETAEPEPEPAPAPVAEEPSEPAPAAEKSDVEPVDEAAEELVEVVKQPEEPVAIAAEPVVIHIDGGAEEKAEEKPAKEEQKDEKPAYDKKDLYAAAKYEGARVSDAKAYAKYVKLSESAVKKLSKELEKLRKSTLEADATETPALVISSIMLAAKIADLRCDGLAISVKYAPQKQQKKLKKILSLAIEDYNGLAGDYATLTGEQLARLSAFLPDYIATETGVAVIPELTYRERYVEVSDVARDADDSEVLSLEAESKNILATTTVIKTPYTDEELFDGLVIEDKGDVAKYAKLAEKAYKTLDKHIAALDKKRGGKKLDDRERLKLYVEALAAKRQKLLIAISVLEKCCEFGNKKLTPDAKSTALDIMLAYNLAVDEYCKMTGGSFTRAISAICDEIIAGRPYKKLADIAYRRELIERVGENIRIVGYSKRTKAIAASEPETATVDAKISVIEQDKKVVEVEDDEKARKAAEAAAVAASRELAKYLAKREKERKKTEKELDKLLKQKNESDGAVRVGNIVKCLACEKLIIDALAADMTACCKANDTKRTQKLGKLLDGEIKGYNKLVKEYGRLTGEKLTEASTKTSQCIAEGKPYPPIPTVVYKPAETAYDHSEVKSMDRAELSKYLQKGEREIAEIRKELSAKLKERDAEKGKGRVVPIVACLGCEKRIIDKLCDHLLASCHVQDQKSIDQTKKALSSEISAYNKLIDEYSSVSGSKLTYAATSIPDDIIAGRSYPGIPNISCSVTGGTAAKAGAAAAVAVAAGSDSKSDKRSAKEAELQRKMEKEEEKNRKHAEKMAKEDARAEREAAAVAKRDEKNAKQAEKQAKKDAQLERDVALLEKKEEKNAKQAEKQSKKSAKEHKKEIQEAKKAAKLEKENAKQAKKDAKLEKKNAKQAKKDAKLEKKNAKLAKKEAKEAKKEAKLNREAEAAAKKDAKDQKKEGAAKADTKSAATGAEDAKAAIARAARDSRFKDQADKDIALITYAADFHLSMLENEREVANYRFGGDSKSSKSRSKEIKREITLTNKEKKAAIKYEEMDNERYYAVAGINLDTATFKRKKVKKNKLESIKKRVIELLDERASVNAQLAAIYTGVEVDVGGVSSNQKWSTIKSEAAAKEYKRQRPLEKRVKRLPASSQEKKKIFDLMNNKVDAVSSIALLKWRIKNEKLGRSDKKKLLQEIKLNEKKVHHIEQDIRYLARKAHVRAENSGGAGGVVMTIIGLILAAGLAFAIYVLIPENGMLDTVKELLEPILPKN